MARPTTLRDFQAAQRGEMDAGGDFDGVPAPAAVVERDPLTGGLADTEVETEEDRLAAEQHGTDGLGGDRPTEHEYDVDPDGTIRDWRAYGPGQASESEPYEPKTHTITDDDDQRFSGGGTSDTLPFGNESKLIPSDASFSNRLFKPAPGLANIAEKLIGQHGFLDDLNACHIEYQWRRKGGGSKGKHKIGFLKRVSAELTIYTTANYIIWLAADTARLAQFTDQQVEAALFHQLLHIDQDDKGNWIKVPHDFEGFGTEIRHYGPWTEDLKIGSQAFTTAVQLGLDLDADDDADDDEDEADDEHDLSDLPDDDDAPVAEGLDDDL